MLYFEITETDSVKKYNVQKCECSFVFRDFFKALLNAKQYPLIKWNPGALTSVRRWIKSSGIALVKKFI